jgi:hypothetical protein
MYIYRYVIIYNALVTDKGYLHIDTGAMVVFSPSLSSLECPPPHYQAYTAWSVLPLTIKRIRLAYGKQE